MIKRFCDCCGREIDGESRTVKRLKGTTTIEGTLIRIEVTAGVDTVANSGDLCIVCLVESLLSVSMQQEIGLRREIEYVTTKVMDEFIRAPQVDEDTEGG